MIRKIKCEYFLKNIIDCVSEKIYLNVLKYNKELQKKLNLSINSYIKFFNQIVIEVIPKEKRRKKCPFINRGNKNFYHIFFDEGRQEIKRNYILSKEKVMKIKIIIDMNVKSLTGLFKGCRCLKEIKFIKFNRNDISKMSKMFYKCKSLTNLDITKLKTDNVKSMRYMFADCQSLLALDLSNMKTDNVTNMEGMFCYCYVIEKLDVSKFKTDKVTNMYSMFRLCRFLKELDLSNFKTDKVTNMGKMFYQCISLNKLNISKFNTEKVTTLFYFIF